MHELYFDCAATTPLLKEVKEAIVQNLEQFGNPSSLHRLGVEAEKRIEEARESVKECLGAPNGKLIFTSSGTESNNMAIFGVAKRFSNRGNHMVTTAVEHSCVLGAFKQLEQAGWNITYVEPEKEGSISAEQVIAAVTSETVLVSVMHVNNETGAIFPIEEIATGVRKKGRVLLHVDGTQAFGKLPLHRAYPNADLYSLSGHKVGAMKGIGALYIRQGLDLPPLVFGGGQEFGLRSGTQNVLGIVSLGVAAQVAMYNRDIHWRKTTEAMDIFIQGLRDIPGCDVSRPQEVSPYILNATFEGLKGEVLLHTLEDAGLYVSTGAACTSNRKGDKGSHVLRAMSMTPAKINGAIRFSIGWWTTQDEVTEALQIVKQKVAWLRQLLG